jgi:hypothetical protein
MGICSSIPSDDKPSVLKPKQVKVFIVAKSNDKYSANTDVSNILNFWNEKCKVSSVTPKFFAIYNEEKSDLFFDNVAHDDTKSFTVENFNRGINWLVKDTASGDLCVFHYIGDGGVVYDDSNTEKEGVDCYLKLDENIRINDYEIRASLVDKMPVGSTLVSVIDARNAGTLLDLKYEYQDTSFVSQKNMANSKDFTIKYTNCGFKTFKSVSFVPVFINIENPYNTASKANILSIGTCYENDCGGCNDLFNNGMLTCASLNSFNENFNRSVRDVIKDTGILMSQVHFKCKCKQICQFTCGTSVNMATPFNSFVQLN